MPLVGFYLGNQSRRGESWKRGEGLILARRSAEDAENETSQMLVEYPSKA